MRFKYWFYITEAISPEDKDYVLKSKLYQNEKDQTIKNNLDQLLAKLESDPQSYTKGDIFKKIEEIIPLTKKKTGIATKKITDDKMTIELKDKLQKGQITQPEFETYILFKNEDKVILTEMMQLLRRFIQSDLIQLNVANNQVKISFNNQAESFNDLTRVMSKLHSIEGETTKYKQAKGTFNPIENENKYEQYLTKGDNVWVYRGDTPDLCRLFGKGQKWCISSSTSTQHWFHYRMDYHQTQYFVFDFNKPENDPARYVNPGVAPDGMYSEWVDAKNTHEKDPQDPNSQIGINGYSTIDQYKQYLASKGIPESTWKTIAPESWEIRLQGYINNYHFFAARKDSDPRIFPMFLKVSLSILDSHFQLLSDEEKKEFVLSKIFYLTKEQYDFAKKVSGYYNSLSEEDKLVYIAKTGDTEKLKPIANQMDDEKFSILFQRYIGITQETKDKIVDVFLNEKTSFSVFFVEGLLSLSKWENQLNVANQLINKIGNLSKEHIHALLKNASQENILEISMIILNKNQVFDPHAISYISNRINLEDLKPMIPLIINKLDYIDKDIISDLLFGKKEERIKEISYKLLEKFSDTFQKSDDCVVAIIKYTNITPAKTEVLDHIIDIKKEISCDLAAYLIDHIKITMYNDPEIKEEKILSVLDKVPELSENLINHIFQIRISNELVFAIIDKAKIITDENIKSLVHNVNIKMKDLLRKLYQIRNKITEEGMIRFKQLMNDYLITIEDLS